MFEIVLFFLSCFPFLCATGFQPLPRYQVVQEVVPLVDHSWTLLQASPESSATTEEEDGISDAEALLACWSYLKRRKRIGNWTNAERRKAIKESIKESGRPSFFWGEDDSELLMDGDVEYEDDEGEEEYYDRNIDGENTDYMDGEKEVIENEDDFSTEWFGEFTSFPTEPTVTRARRSYSAKQVWKDPEFRKRWQESRWGNKLSKDDKHKRLVESRVKKLPREFWGSDELASMTKEDINMAIESYVNGRKKRSANVKKALQERKKALEFPSPDSEDDRVARNSLFAADHETLKEQQRLRSQKAKARYQTRLDNEQRKKGALEPKKPASKRTYLPSGSTPQDAVMRIESKLDAHEYPAVSDLKIIMVPQKLGKRRGLLKRILLDFFNLRGKCIPIDLTDESSDKEFITKAPIQQLGEFAIELLEKRAEEE
ncbi:unnamed protein product [Cylindrotheca closterium]|uniref:Ribosome biogenesis protein NOP53 n=1 Tax=Cylindrotheca closterium TaxID=2856 RepID=A0AAD2CB52_9STRA|nr:unnamed protein product [Cylindrotheca closterium]